MDNLLSTLLVSAITAYITVRLAISQFHAQKQWEEKHAAYCQIIEALAFFHHYLGEFFDDNLGTRILEKEQKIKLQEEYHLARKTIAKYRAIGNFIVSENTEKELLKVLAAIEDLDNGGDRTGDDMDCWEEIENSLAKVKIEAQNDLKKVSWLTNLPILEKIRLTN